MKRKHLLILFLGVLFTFNGCGDNCNFNVDWGNISEIVESYHNSSFTDSKDSVTNSEELDLYMDFTLGLYVAFTDDNSVNFFKNVINSLKLSKINLFELANDSVLNKKGITKEDIFKKLDDQENFMESYAPFEKALNQIVSNNKQALFISDCELWIPGKGESDLPWAREPFANWLKKGNKIDFFITDHIDAGKEKHVFYIMFIPFKETIAEKNYSSDIHFFLKNNSEARELKYTNFAVSNIVYSFEQNYKTEKSGGAKMELALESTTYVNNPKNYYEYQEWGLDWNGIVEYVKNAKDEKTGKIITDGAELLKDLIFSSENPETYDISELDIKTIDIYEDFEKFYIYEECKKNPPKFKLNDKGEKEIDVNNNNLPIIENPGNPCCYDEKGNLNKEYAYKKSDLKEIKELFLFDKNRFNITYPKERKGEIAIKVHPNFNGTQISSDRENLLRVDIIIKKCSPITDNPNLDKFKWEGKEILINKAMYDSIIMALKDANPEGKVIYTFYIKTQPNNI